MEKLLFQLVPVPPFRLDLASGLNDHRLDLEALPGEGDETAVKSLTRLPGIGRWTTEYFLLSGAGVIGVDNFSASAPGDVVLREYGFNLDNVVRKVHEALKASKTRVKRVVKELKR